MKVGDDWWNTFGYGSWTGEEWRKVNELDQWNGLQSLVSWVGGRVGLELGRRAGFMVDGLVQISNGGKETNLKGRWRRKCEERDGWDEIKENEEKK